VSAAPLPQSCGGPGALCQEQRVREDRPLTFGSDELLAALRVLNGYDIDLAAGATRLASQSRIERVVKERSPRIAAKLTTAIAAALAGMLATGQPYVQASGRATRPGGLSQASRRPGQTRQPLLGHTAH
jgi:hypothetical protein